MNKLLYATGFAVGFAVMYAIDVLPARVIGTVYTPLLDENTLAGWEIRLTNPGITISGGTRRKAVMVGLVPKPEPRYQFFLEAQ